MAKSVNVILGTCGSPEYFAMVDPYRESDNWHEAARGDGSSYAGVLFTVTPQEGDSQDSVLEKALSWAREYNNVNTLR